VKSSQACSDKAQSAGLMSAIALGIGSHVLVEGPDGDQAPATVQMETSTQLLVRIDGSDRWVPRSRVVPDSVDGDGAVAASDHLPAVAVTSTNGKREREADADGPAPRTHRGSAAACDEDTEVWDDECFFCGNGGKLTCCDACPRVYHLRCLPAAESAKLRLPGAADKEWWCPRCQRVANLAFCMGRQLAHPALAEGATDDAARRLFAFMSDGMHEMQWEPLREAGAALLHSMPTSHLWQPRSARAADGPAQQAADLLAARVGPDWWAGAFAAAPAAPSVAAPAAPAGDDGGGNVAGVRTSIYRGVSKRYGKWKARIKEKGHDIVIGEYEDEIEAARAYDKKARALHGDRAALNFPDEG
jgi:hypothetical protein